MSNKKTYTIYDCVTVGKNFHNLNAKTCQIQIVHMTFLSKIEEYISMNEISQKEEDYELSSKWWWKEKVMDREQAALVV